MEFNLGVALIKGYQHPMKELMEKYFLALENRDSKFMQGVQTISIRLLVKLMNQYMAEKGIAAIDSLHVKNEHITEFIYDQNFNKFGIAKLTEKKIKEILLTINKNKSRIPKCEFYARMLGISEEKQYSNDDLSLLYNINKTLNEL